MSGVMISKTSMVRQEVDNQPLAWCCCCAGAVSLHPLRKPTAMTVQPPAAYPPELPAPPAVVEQLEQIVGAADCSAAVGTHTAGGIQRLVLGADGAAEGGALKDLARLVVGAVPGAGHTQEHLLQ